jgi:hypothetical protein
MRFAEYLGVELGQTPYKAGVLPCPTDGQVFCDGE